MNAGKIIEKALAAKRSPENIIEELYERSLSRKPNAVEAKAMLELVGKNVTDRKVYEDIFWSLLTSTEFLFNH